MATPQPSWPSKLFIPNKDAFVIPQPALDQEGNIVDVAGYIKQLVDALNQSNNNLKANFLAAQDYINRNVVGVDLTSASQTLTSGVALQPTFTTVNFDYYKIFTSPSTITIPEDGVYVVTFNAYFDGLTAASGDIFLSSQITPTTGVANFHEHIVDSTVTSADRQGMTGAWFMTRGQTIVAKVEADNITAGHVTSHLSMWKIGDYPSKVQ